MTKQNIAIFGILLCGIYFLTVAFFIIIPSQTSQTIFEITTMLSSIFFVVLVISFPFAKDDSMHSYKILATTFVVALLTLTTIVHVANLTMLQLIKNGIVIPDYLQLGKTPSVITAIEYLGWGIFLGLAFLFSAFGIDKNIKYKSLKTTLYICAVLCLLGFFGWLINENLWYIASIGYGLGTLIICVNILHFCKIKI